jgi:hypothetical protein
MVVNYLELTADATMRRPVNDFWSPSHVCDGQTEVVDN